VIVIQENRSFNTIFGGPSPFPNASTSAYGAAGSVDVALSKIELTSTACDISHDYEDAKAAVNPNPTPTGTYQMNGFNTEKLMGDKYASDCVGNAGVLPYAYVDYAETKPYWFMASHWGLADHFYPTEFGPSYTAHINFIASTTEIAPTYTSGMLGEAVVDFPSNFGGSPDGCKSDAASVKLIKSNFKIVSPGVFPCFWEFHTMADLLDAHNISWRYYAPYINDTSTGGGALWSEFSSIEQVRCGQHIPLTSKCSGTGTDWKYVVSPANTILKDINSSKLPDVAWVVPTFANSDHQGSGSATGPSWVASIVNAIGGSSYWTNTVIVVVWDDWGGWYDEDPPPIYDYRGKAIRTPMIVISAYTKSGGTTSGGGWLSHDEYEPGSILKYIENVWGTGTLSGLPCYYYCSGSLGYTDSSALHSIKDNMLDTSQSPKPFTPVPTPKGYDSNYFTNLQSQSGPAPDDQ
jgi:phospholipase C